MAPSSKRTTKRVTKYQIEMIVQAMEENEKLNKGSISLNYTASQKHQDWEQLALKLNAAGGAVKELEKWQKCWTDKKSETKAKYIHNKNEVTKTGGATADLKDITPMDDRILALIGFDAVEGLAVPESCSFQQHPSGRHEDEEYIVPNAVDSVDFPDSNVTNIDLEVYPGSTTDIQLDETPSVETPSVSRLNSVGGSKRGVKRTRNRGMVLGSENSQKLIKAQESTASGLMAVAAALERNADNQQQLINLEKERIELEKRKTEAFERFVIHFIENFE